MQDHLGTETGTIHESNPEYLLVLKALHVNDPQVQVNESDFLFVGGGAADF